MDHGSVSSSGSSWICIIIIVIIIMDYGSGRDRLSDHLGSCPLEAAGSCQIMIVSFVWGVKSGLTRTQSTGLGSLDVVCRVAFTSLETPHATDTHARGKGDG